MGQVTYSTLRLLVKDECNRGNTVDRVIDSKIQQAVTFIEMNYTLLYMEQIERRVLDGGAGPYSQPYNNKSINWIRLVSVGLDGSTIYSPLEKIHDARNQPGVAVGDPCGYYVDGKDWLYFNSVVVPATTVDIQVDRLSGPFRDDSFCWLFDFGMEIIVARAMMNFCGWLKQPGLYPIYAQQFQTGIRTLLVADAKARRESTSLTYGQLAA